MIPTTDVYRARRQRDVAGPQSLASEDLTFLAGPTCTGAISQGLIITCIEVTIRVHHVSTEGYPSDGRPMPVYTIVIQDKKRTDLAVRGIPLQGTSGCETMGALVLGLKLLEPQLGHRLFPASLGLWHCRTVKVARSHSEWDEGRWNENVPLPVERDFGRIKSIAR